MRRRERSLGPFNTPEIYSDERSTEFMFVTEDFLLGRLHIVGSLAHELRLL
jgi:hypothetical protein